MPIVYFAIELRQKNAYLLLILGRPSAGKDLKFQILGKQFLRIALKCDGLYGRGYMLFPVFTDSTEK